jgi:UDP-N-acetylglucosamine 4,6-dehydratase
LLRPAIKFHHGDIDYGINGIGEHGKPVPNGFEYNSGTNEHFLSTDEIREFNGG